MSIPSFIAPIRNKNGRPFVIQAWNEPRPTAAGIHAGFDFPAPNGTPVVAVAGGKVRFAGPATDGRGGNMIWIDHAGGFMSRYLHLSDILVREGDSISQGQHIANSGDTDSEGAPHLHFDFKGSQDAVSAFLLRFSKPNTGLPSSSFVGGTALPAESLIEVDYANATLKKSRAAGVTIASGGGSLLGLLIAAGLVYWFFFRD